MKNKKFKILAAVFIIIVVGISIAFYKPAKFEAISLNGKIIQCERGKVTVPEVREDAKSNQIKVGYVRLKSFSPNPKEPIFFLAGGPGQSATWQAENEHYLEYWSAFLETRDVVLVDQRGVGKIKMWWVKLGWPGKDVLVTEDAAKEHFISMTDKAASAFQRRGIDLSGYNSIESAHDIDTVRDKLGYKQIIPFGFSYGTHLGLSYIKYHEERVAQAILMGVEGLDHNFKMPLDLDNHFEMIADIVEKDSLMSQDIPDFVALYDQAAKKLSAQPLELEITTPIKLKRKVRVGKFGLDFILKRDLGDASDIPYFPRLLHNIVYGDGSRLKWYVEKRYREFMAIPAMMMSMDLASGGSQERLEKIRQAETKSMFGAVSNLPFIDVHQKWPVKDLGEAYRAKIRTDIPTLFLSGSLDVNTPAYQADSIMTGFSNGAHLVVQNAGHEQIQFHWDMSATILDFLNGADVRQVSMAYPPLQFKALDR